MVSSADKLCGLMQIFIYLGSYQRSFCKGEARLLILINTSILFDAPPATSKHRFDIVQGALRRANLR